RSADHPRSLPALPHSPSPARPQHPRIRRRPNARTRHDSHAPTRAKRPRSNIAGRHQHLPEGLLNPSGVVVPMITPFTPAGAIDEPAVARLVDHFITNRIAGIFPLGTTGEAASIHPDDRRRLVAAIVKSVARRATVYA